MKYEAFIILMIRLDPSYGKKCIMKLLPHTEPVVILYSWGILAGCIGLFLCGEEGISCGLYQTLYVGGGGGMITSRLYQTLSEGGRR